MTERFELNEAGVRNVGERAKKECRGIQHILTRALNLYLTIMPHLDDGGKLFIKNKDGEYQEVKGL